MKALRVVFQAAFVLLAVSCGRFAPTQHPTVYHAARAGDLDDVRRHIMRGHLLDVRGDSGATAAHMAALRGDTTLLGILWRGGADMDARDSLGRGILGYAAFDGRADMAGHILRNVRAFHPGTPEAPNLSGSWAFKIAISRDDAVFIDTLLAHGADPRADFGIRGSPLEWAVINDADQVLKLLVERGADLHLHLDDGGTLLHLAAQAYTPQQTHSRMIHTLLELGLNPNVQDSLGRTPLHLAIKYGYPETAAVLLEHRADPTVRDKEGETPAELARRRADQGEPRFLSQLRNNHPRS